MNEEPGEGRDQGCREHCPIEESSGDMMERGEDVEGTAEMERVTQGAQEPAPAVTADPREGAGDAAGATDLAAPSANDKNPPLAHGGPHLTGCGAQGRAGLPGGWRHWGRVQGAGPALGAGGHGVPIAGPGAGAGGPRGPAGQLGPQLSIQRG